MTKYQSEPDYMLSHSAQFSGKMTPERNIYKINNTTGFILNTSLTYALVLWLESRRQNRRLTRSVKDLVYGRRRAEAGVSWAPGGVPGSQWESSMDQSYGSGPKWNLNEDLGSDRDLDMDKGKSKQYIGRCWGMETRVGWCSGNGDQGQEPGSNSVQIIMTSPK
ncbi:hypothetical protein SCHPADRAFT_891290 [Schizopora paradoxa]|uniref:Uncharacterized protein n=1 Tax=Schizopora paradoxa TaxID=27342 RepID=A0A0H2RJM1_9AGAM|nr:hypothetical protein SCHPADRAFT_891290 [Schizopora paradoxa]